MPTRCESPPRFPTARREGEHFGGDLPPCLKDQSACDPSGVRMHISVTGRDVPRPICSFEQSSFPNYVLAQAPAHPPCPRPPAHSPSAPTRLTAVAGSLLSIGSEAARRCGPVTPRGAVALVTHAALWPCDATRRGGLGDSRGAVAL